MPEPIHFRFALYLMVGLGFAGFGFATESPLVFLLGEGLLLTNALLIRAGRFRPLPRWAANSLTLIAATYTGLIIVSEVQPIVPIGNFLVTLQLIKLYEQRADRDFAQVLILSLLLMVAAAISTAGLGFGVMFVTYLLLAPYVSLLFHLKVEADHARRVLASDRTEAMPDTVQDRPRMATWRRDQRPLRRSLTRVAATIGVISLTTAVLVFLFFPRVPGGVISIPYRPTGGPSYTGMSDELELTSVTSVQQNTAEVASLTVTRNGEPVVGGELYLRGSAFNYYSGGRAGGRWNWHTTPSVMSPTSPNLSSYQSGSEIELDDRPPLSNEQWVQRFNPLKAIGVKFLPALPGAIALSPDRSLLVASDLVNGVIRTESIRSALRYEVTSTGIQRAGPTHEPPPSVIAKEISDYARLPTVSGVDDDNQPLAKRLEDAGGAKAVIRSQPRLIEEIARNIERHLQNEFSYTLDLGDADRSKDDDLSSLDPIVRFLIHDKKGWCEHFAGAMTLMCQSLGLDARIVSGYQCDEYNSMGGWFVVRQSQAHAWVEVRVHDERLNEDVWLTFDPTASGDATGLAGRDTPWQRVTHFLNFLEHVWSNNVVAYDAAAQTGMVTSVEGRLAESAERANDRLQSLGNWVRDWSDRLFNWRYNITAALIVALLCLMSLAAIGMIVWYSVVRLRLSRRARRIGLAAVGKPEARRLARQLGFYDDLVRVLERRSIVRPTHLTPLEFGRSLSFLPRDAYDPIVRLTRIFYRVRFGGAVLTPTRQRKLERVVDGVREAMTPRHRHRH